MHITYANLPKSFGTNAMHPKVLYTMKIKQYYSYKSIISLITLRHM